MTFLQLQYIVEISRCGSMNKAAKSLFLSQSSLSHAVQALEAELNITIFRRTNRGVEFTRAGREFLGYATSLLEQKEHVENIYHRQMSDAPAYFNVSTQRYPFAVDAFVRLLRKSAPPRMHYSLKECSMDDVIDDVYGHWADIGVLFLSNMTEPYIRRLLSARTLEFHEIAALQPCVFLRPGHPLAKKASVTTDDLAGYMYLSFEHNQGVAMDFSEEFHLLSYKRPPQVINVNDRATAINVISSTDAITTGTGLLVEEFRDTRMISIPIEDEGTMRLGWIKAKNLRLSAQAVAFVDLLGQSVQDSLAYTAQLRENLRVEPNG